MRLALFQPDIAQNVGTILRLGACLGVAVDIIEPCGFPFGDSALRRAGLDYLQHASLTRHPAGQVAVLVASGKIVDGERPPGSSADLSNFHAPYQPAANVVNMLNHLVDKDLAGHVAHYLMYVHDRASVHILGKAPRHDVRRASSLQAPRRTGRRRSRFPPLPPYRSRSMRRAYPWRANPRPAHPWPA